jgi:hypothetical protein
MHLGGATYVLDPLFSSMRFAFGSAFFVGQGRLHGSCQDRHLVSFADRFLEQPEQFEHDYDNDNYSNDIEDASVHVGANIKLSV